MSTADTSNPALDRAIAKAYRRLIPLLFLCYMVAYVDRTNVSIAKLTMVKDMPAFTESVFGFGIGIFFLGYFLLEIPGTLIVERWSARKWICRIMVSWGIVAALTAFVTAPWHFYALRFILGLAEAGFFPGVIVYLTHWFPARDRTRALAAFLIATPVAQILSPKLSNYLIQVGIEGNPEWFGLEGWQLVYIAWGIPAVVLGLVVLFALTDRPAQAKWLTTDEREALEAQLALEKELRKGGTHMGILQALRHPKVLILAAAYFLVVTANYGVEMFLPSILESWYHMNLNKVTWLVVLPPIGSLIGQLFIGWNSDRTHERRLHTAGPMLLGAASLATVAFIKDPPLWLTVSLFFLALTGLKAYLPAFWSLPSLFLTEAAAASSIGLINSMGNLGGFLGPYVLGVVKESTGDYRIGIMVLATSMALSASIIIFLGLGRSDRLPVIADPAKLREGPLATPATA
jgi:ACS family tartrate transporter-like MFS transporter